MNIQEIQQKMSDMGYRIVGLRSPGKTEWIIRPNRQFEQIKWEDIEKAIEHLPPGKYQICGKIGNRSAEVQYEIDTIHTRTKPVIVSQDHSNNGKENLVGKSIDFERLGKLEALVQFQADTIANLEAEIERLNNELEIYDNELAEDAAAQEQLSAPVPKTSTEMLIEAALPAVPQLLDGMLTYLNKKVFHTPNQLDNNEMQAPASSPEIDYERLATMIHQKFTQNGAAEA